MNQDSTASIGQGSHTPPSNYIRFRDFIHRAPSLLKRIPSIAKGMKLSNIRDPEIPVGIAWSVEQCVRINPLGTALIYEDRKLSYQSFNAWANRLAQALSAEGIKKGDVVSVLIENRPELLACITALSKLGAVASLVNTSQRNKVLIHSINLVKASTLIVGEELVEAVQAVRPQLDVDKENYYYLADRDTLLDAGPTPQGYKNLASLSADCSSQCPPIAQKNALKDHAFYIYTSGTTGLPKAVIFNNDRWMKAFAGIGLAVVGLKTNDIMYTPLPLYHGTALCVCWGSVLAAQATMVIKRRFSATDFWSDVNTHKVTCFGYVGELCRYLLNQPPKPDDANNTVIKIVGNGLRPSIWQPFKKRFGIQNIVELYASSEGNVSFTNIYNFDNTVGICLFPYAIVAYDKETEKPVRNRQGKMIKVRKGEPGLLLGKITAKTPFIGYTEQEKNKSVIYRDVFKKGDAWYNTNDLMRNIGFRHAQFVDRLGDTFRWKGENVSTTEVENTINAHPDISETVCYGVEIPETNGRAGMASILLQNETKNIDFTSLYSYLSDTLPPYAIPVFLRLTESLDKTGTFKYKKSDLKKEAFDPRKTKDRLYITLPDRKDYIPLTEEVYTQVTQSQYRF